MEAEETLAAPDSTTREQRLGFAHGEDVLLHNDGKYYLGTVVEVNLSREQCLVKFLDNTSSWSSFKDLTKLAMPDSDVMCVLCKKSHPKTDNDIIVCDKCGRGYHQLCHQPNIKKEETCQEAHWMCKKCVDSQSRSRDPTEPKNSMVKANIRKVCSGRNERQPPPDDMTKLPYDPNMLNWDAHHRVNAEQIYCYCGLNGEWYTQMLQCNRCKQWFHEKCINYLKFPLYSGDRFYIFVCAMCNYGQEYIRRLELKWVDLVHLMLYNLTVYNAKKYYDLDSVIIPYANDNWSNLQLPEKIESVNSRVRRETILAILMNNRNRFKCGREIKKRTTIWGLRIRLPPPCPIVNIPLTGPIDDSVLRHYMGNHKRLQYLLPTEDTTMGNVMSLPMAPVALNPQVTVHVNSSNVVLHQGETQSSVDVENSSCPIISNESTESLRERYSGGGYVKKSTPFPKLSLERRKRLMAIGNSRERMLRKHKKKELGQGDASPNAQGERQARFRKARKLLKNAIAKSKNRSPGPEPSQLPPTPPTSVSGPPTPPAALSELSIPELIHPQPPSTPADTSGDETSSRGTLDSIIPPPKDFEGNNNPFRNLNDLLGTPYSQTSASTPAANNSPITLPLPLTPVIYGYYPKPMARPTKRQLSEKDIIVDSNGQVKRRRTCRRGRPPSSQQQNFQQTASKTAAILPARNNEINKNEFIRNLRSSNGSSSNSSSHLDDVEFAMQGRRLRQRHGSEKVVAPPPEAPKKTASSPAKSSPVKQNAPEMSIDDLKSSVNSYFGAANRIKAGERYIIKGMRTLENGQKQYLIEWGEPST